MAKALYGHVGGPDPDLESELARLQDENDVLIATVGQDLLIPVREPALA
jgi:hypothetical protein